MIYCSKCSRTKQRPVHHRAIENCPEWKRKHRKGYYAPMSTRRLIRHEYYRHVPWIIRWLLGWR